MAIDHILKKLKSEFLGTKADHKKAAAALKKYQKQKSKSAKAKPAKAKTKTTKRKTTKTKKKAK
jgi:hypothetical protein